ncbi:Low molecular weight phosphotyrosine protein phosphatase [Hypsizygus marmoreus]|uniref:Low molecular weight phosphotyrosine protein phosphatase n=1 Tax=Hypsizygus marmoreus TaxID=39966 RepID=A0A369K5K8_HYPMA|nr:Low molecular weight phosphotyrosine protein phosphatase [Hypsizygus marmoreus]
MSPSTTSNVKVLVVCLGNICRSPMGEAVLQDIATKRGLDIVVDSCGTAGYHQGSDPDERTVAVCKKHGVPISSVARQVTYSDFTKFTHILAADESNLRDLLRKKPGNATADVRLWGSYLDNKAIPDPYYGGTNGFEKVFEQCTQLSNAFLDEVFGKEVP